MPSTFRIPRADVTGPYAAVVTAVTRRWLGQVPDNLYVYWHHRPLLRAVMGFERRVAGWDRLDPHLKTYAEMAAAAQIGCSWCLDFGYFMSQRDGLDPAKVSEVPRWRTSSVFSDLQRAVMAYAEALTATPPTVTDEMVAGLLAELGEAAVVELTQMIALENMRSRFNLAAGLESQGFSESCALRLAAPERADSAP